MASNTITFTDDSPEGTGHNKALHIQVMCKHMVVARVLVDNGSALNVCPLITIQKLGISKSNIRPSNITFRAFDGSKREVLGDLDLPIGPCTFEVTFQMSLQLPISC